MRCLVTGASGAVGPVLVDRLLANGDQVAVLSRDPDRVRWPARVAVRRGDVLDSTRVQAAVADTDVVFHLAAMLHVPSPPPELHADSERVNVEGTRVVVEAARARRVRRVVLFSTIAVYGPTGGRVVDEATAPAPDTMYARTKLAAETIVLGARSDAGDSLGTVLRAAAVYGGRVKGNYARLVRGLHRRRFVPIGDGHNRRTLVFEDDLADAAVTAATANTAAGRIFNVSDGRVHQMSEIIDAMSEALGRRRPRVHIPEGLARMIASAADAACRAVGVRRAFRAAVDTYLGDVAVDATLIQNALGWQPRVDLRVGWMRAVATMRDAGWL